MRLFTLFLFFWTTSTIASTFNEQAINGDAALKTRQGKVYEQKLGSHIYEAIKNCAPVGSTSQKNLGKFTLVANVSSTGRISNSKVAPSTTISNCFKEKFSRLLMPPPPESITIDGFAPIIVEMDVTL